MDNTNDELEDLMRSEQEKQDKMEAHHTIHAEIAFARVEQIEDESRPSTSDKVALHELKRLVDNAQTEDVNQLYSLIIGMGAYLIQWAEAIRLGDELWELPDTANE